MKKAKKIIGTALCAALMATSMGFPAMAAESDRIGVYVNGEPVSLTDAAPKLTDGRTFIPFRAVFVALGFADNEIEYDSLTQTITAVKGGTTLTHVVGTKSITTAKDGQTATVEAAVGSYIDPMLGRTYVPVRFVAQALGCNVGWDNNSRSVIIDDVDSIVSKDTNTYAMAEKLAAFKTARAAENRKIEGRVSGAISAASSSALLSNDEAAFAGTITGLVSDGKADRNLVLTFSPKASSQLPAAFPTALDFQLRADIDAGKLAVKSDGLAKFLGSDITDTWVTFAEGETSRSVNGSTSITVDNDAIDYCSELETLLETDTSDFKEAVKQTLAEKDLTDIGDTCSDTLADIDSLISDAALTKNGNTYTASRSFWFSNAKRDGCDVVLTINTNGAAISDYTMTIDFSFGSATTFIGQPVTIKAIDKDSLSAGNNTVTVNAGSILNFTLQECYGCTATSEQATGAPAAGEKAMGAADFINSMSGLYKAATIAILNNV